jgi:hypothetical protein
VRVLQRVLVRRRHLGGVRAEQEQGDGDGVEVHGATLSRAQTGGQHDGLPLRARPVLPFSHPSRQQDLKHALVPHEPAHASELQDKWPTM